ncbi:MAG: Do family serine endopeptidase [Acidobacteriota bacterium]
MSASRSRHFFTFMLVVGAVVFGMVLAGGLQITPVGNAAVTGAGNAITVSAPGGTLGFADLAEAVEPAVVSIAAATFEEQQRRQNPLEFFLRPPGQRERQRQPDEPQRFRSDSGGSGFVISSDGLIVTNHHVVRGADKLTVTLGDRPYEAEVKGTDPATDLALLKIEAGSSLPYLQLGDSDSLRVGDWVMAIGSPLSLDHTVTVGVVSAKDRALGISDISFENFIQTDAAINFGNSGGPLVNLRGQVIGIATAINYGAENIGFAVPVKTLQDILPQLREDGRVSRGYLGIEITNLDFKDAEAFQLDSPDGALVQAVVAGQPAENAGLRHGDIIVQVDDRPVRDTRDLINYVASKPPGTRVTVEVIRGDDRRSLQIELGERPGLGEPVAAIEDDSEGGIDWLGIEFQGLTSGLRSNHGIADNVSGIWVTSIEPDSALYEEGVRVGDVIAEVNGRDIETVNDFEAAVGETSSGSYVRFYVQRMDPNSSRVISFFAPVRKP